MRGWKTPFLFALLLPKDGAFRAHRQKLCFIVSVFCCPKDPQPLK
jgi:hypothetical protein